MHSTIARSVVDSVTSRYDTDIVTSRFLSRFSIEVSMPLTVLVFIIGLSGSLSLTAIFVAHSFPPE